MEIHPYKVELLAPAGNREAFTGAISAGADAVYLGGEQFGARAYADNFSAEEIRRALMEAHILGRKIYLTANVLTREEELPELVKFVKGLYEAGLDGVIVQDTGVLSALHEACPGLPLHASTQLSVTSSEAVQYLRRLGICRVVPARELSLKEIETLRREDAAWIERLSGGSCASEPIEPIEIEAFIHGAMCYSYSGRCLMSSFLGGRSGNRGRCAGTCRLPYRILDENGKPAGPDAGKKEVYPLSMKDMCVLSILPELIDAGIHSFKIEGRMKKAVYAAGVTAIYRKYIDRFYAWNESGRLTPWKVEKEDLDRLRSLYIRTDLGTGYYHTRNGRNLVTIGKPGYAGTDAVLEEEIRKKYLGGLPARAVEGRAVFRLGEPAALTVTLKRDPIRPGGLPTGTLTGLPDPGPDPEEPLLSVTSEGAVVQRASGRPLQPEELAVRLRRTGDSMFTFSDLQIEADDNIFLPVSAVNALRREALGKLQDTFGHRQGDGNGFPDTPADSGEPETGPDRTETLKKASRRGKMGQGQELWALVSDSAQLQAAAEAGCSCIIVDCPPDDIEELPEKSFRLICALPPVFRVSNREIIRDMIREAGEKGFSGILVRTIEELELVRQMQYRGEVIADSSLYSWNGRSMSTLAADCSRIIASLELNQTSIADAVRAAQSRIDRGDRIADRIILPVYGRIPMMESAGCVRKTENLCSGRDGFWFLEDRRGKRLPVRCRCGTCSNTIYNAVPLSLHQFAGRGLYREVPAHLCMFTTESAGQTRKILDLFTDLQRQEGEAFITSLTASSRTGKKKKRPAGKDSARPVSGSGKGPGGGKKENSPLPFDDFTNGHFKTGAL